MKFSLLTYNLLYNRATPNIAKVLAKYKPDILCFQEMITDEANFALVEAEGYRLADYSNFIVRFGKIFGVATFYKPKVFTFATSLSFNLPRAMIEMLLYFFQIRLDPRFVLKTHFTVKKTGKPVYIYNMHLTPYATNALRSKQIENVFPDLAASGQSPVVVAGDFNYPYKRKGLETVFKEYRLKEATNAIFTTYERKILKLINLAYKTDYILYRNLKAVETKKIMVRYSDHYPILSTFEL